MSLLAPLRRSLLILVALAACAGAAQGEAPPALRFLRDGAEVAKLSLPALLECCSPREVRVDDPYYGGPKRFRALPLALVLARGFGDTEHDAFARSELLLRARDGYTRTASGEQLLGEGAFLAFADAEHPGGAFFPIDRRQVDPAPFYLVWQGEGRSDTTLWPWPYQLAEIEVVDFARAFPHVVPQGAAPDSAAQRGFALFRASCIACHAINGEGGTVGPELNVPRSIVEYRDAEQLKAFIRDPRSFRYTSMPAHPHFRDADLDALIAYFTHMSAHKRDPGAGPGH
ncbi:MAG: cytochrome c [Deltaproteobacteria bacterium]|nr:cytochrome c [Deltaproteobacteria bacterium]